MSFKKKRNGTVLIYETVPFFYLLKQKLFFD